MTDYETAVQKRLLQSGTEDIASSAGNGLDVSITFPQAMPDANYKVLLTMENDNASGNEQFFPLSVDTKSTTGLVVQARNVSVSEGTASVSTNMLDYHIHWEVFY